MEALNRILPITMDQFLPTVIRYKLEERRRVQINACRIEGGYELSYSFASGYNMDTLRLTVQEDELVSSITQIYPCAFMQENEAAELFGVKIENIDRDYNGRLYRIDRQTPFKEKG